MMDSCFMWIRTSPSSPERCATSWEVRRSCRVACRVSVCVANTYVDSDTIAEPVLLPKVDAVNLHKVIRYCEHHKDDAVEVAGVPIKWKDYDFSTQSLEKEIMQNNKEISEWDKEFATMEQQPLFDLILAANFMNVHPLLMLCCRTAAESLKGKTSKQIREYLSLGSDSAMEVDAPTPAAE